MHPLQLTFWYFTLAIFSPDPAFEYPVPSPAKVVSSVANVEPGATNIIYQSTDGGHTWQDISGGLPRNEQPESIFAGESGIYLRFSDKTYSSRSNLKAPVWAEESGLDPRLASISVNRSGVLAYNYAGQIYQKKPSAATWVPAYPNIERRPVETIFEAADGTVFVGCRNGLYKSADKGESWKQVLDEVQVTGLAESGGVLVARGQNRIMRSTDHGEHWETVMMEGGVVVTVEPIEGGFASIAYSSKTQSRRIRVSLDRGKTWEAIDEGLQPSLSISSIKQVGRYLICGHPDGIFRSSDLGKTWDVVHPGVDRIPFPLYRTTGNAASGKVFKIYVSGNVLYAVAGFSGC